MLVKIPLLSFLLFALTYPLCLWLQVRNPIGHNFHRFHLGCPVFIGGVAVMGLWLLPCPQTLKNLAAMWVVAFLLVTALFWNKEKVHLGAVTLIVLWGIKLFAAVYSQFVSSNTTEIMISLLSGLVVSAIFYAMNLGHFYLNVHGLDITHLRTAVRAFALLLFLRLLWNILYISTAYVMQGGEEVDLLRFMITIEGFMLWVALFFGALFPFIACTFAFGTLKLKNTQATTGILYVLLSAVLLGDLAYKYYLLKYSIPL